MPNDQDHEPDEVIGEAPPPNWPHSTGTVTDCIPGPDHRDDAVAVLQSAVDSLRLELQRAEVARTAADLQLVTLREAMVRRFRDYMHRDGESPYVTGVLSQLLADIRRDVR